MKNERFEDKHDEDDESLDKEYVENMRFAFVLSFIGDIAGVYGYFVFMLFVVGVFERARVALIDDTRVLRFILVGGGIASVVGVSLRYLRAWKRCGVKI